MPRQDTMQPKMIARPTVVGGQRVHLLVGGRLRQQGSISAVYVLLPLMNRERYNSGDDDDDESWPPAGRRRFLLSLSDNMGRVEPPTLLPLSFSTTF